MSVITKVLKQTCVYWEPNAVDDFGGASYLSPIELSCRWDDLIQEIIGQTEDKVISKASVMVSQDVKVGGVLFLGTLDDVTDFIDPKQNENTGEIISFARIPNFKATEFVRTAYLK